MEMIVLMIIIAVAKSVMDSNRAKQKSKALEQNIPPPQPIQAAPMPNGQAEVKMDLGDVLFKMGERVWEATTGGTKKNLGNQATEAKQSEKAKAQEAQTVKKKKVAEDRAKEMERPVHEKLRPSVTPLKNAFDNTEDCGHRISLNPHMQYQRPTREVKVGVKINPSKDNVIQGIIWSEILGAPKSRRH